jgi:hypothetical protein
MPIELQLHLDLQSPPPGIDFGVQKGSSNRSETVFIQRSGDKDLHFSLSVMVKGDPARDELPDFSGPYVQGKRLERFFYIDVGACAGQIGGWQRRMKIPLYCITWALVKAAAGKSLRTRVPGTAKDGGPNCATIKPFAGWTVGE